MADQPTFPDASNPSNDDAAALVSTTQSATSTATLVDRTIDLTDASPLLRVVPAPLNPPVDEPRVLHKAIGPLALLAIVMWCAAIGQLRTLAVVGALAFMILFHEAGHFVAARLTGMKATEFFLGFGPRLFSFRRGETEFGVKALPLGGYVKVIGMTNLEKLDDPADEPKTYRAATYPRKVLLASAGTIAHFILAFALLMTLFTGYGGVTQIAQPVVGGVEALEVGASPAATAGIKPGDRIIAVGEKAVTKWDDMSSAIRNAGTEPVSVTVDRNGVTKTMTVRPVVDFDGQTRIGVQWQDNAITTTRSKVGIVAGAGESVRYMVRLVPETWGGLFKFFAPDSLQNYGTTLTKAATNKPLTQAESENRMSSAVGITRMITDASRDNIRMAIELFAIVNIFVGMFNMLPLLPLDGGHVLVATYERIRSRRGVRHAVDFRRLLPLTYVVITIMGIIGVSSLYLDITEPLKLF